jgi:hypothetical protein
MQKEIWKDVKGYEGLYQVSNLGSVKSLKRTVNVNKSKLCTKVVFERILKNGINSSGYYNLTLCKNGSQKTRLVHQLVAIAFLGHTPNGQNLVINHIDFNKLNNNVENLVIITQRENANKKHLNHSSKYTGVCWVKKSKKWVSSIAVNGKSKTLGYFDSEKDAHLVYETKLKEIL